MSLGLAGTAQAADPAPDHFARFATEVQAFAARDRQAASDATTLFIGSSSIRFWDLPHSFPGVAAMNHGFGGATTPDVLHYYGDVVAGEHPATVVVYVGENDIAEGRRPEAVTADVLALLRRLKADLPQSRLLYLSMKPSPARWTLWPKMSEANMAIRASAGTIGFQYVDVGSVLLTPAGTPNASYFRPDGLHMNAQGYALWNDMIDDLIAPPRNQAPRQASVS
ncbi:GDSL-type esterase/lipase family protein [Flavisphingomonas formosensis]|uniref:GDSL-type esterase/lipase family protein n=1 Tax=Flavisphingomonas formosensis TaxID=861534 RepID=UPI001E466D58|nr:GDSL-type esterase/lipase family protein [Sphingomonas formosensis]